MRSLARNYLEETGMLHWSFAAVIFTFFNDMKEAEPGQNVLGKTLFSQTIKIREHFNSDEKKELIK